MIKHYLLLFLISIFTNLLDTQHEWIRTNPGGGGVYISYNNGQSWKPQGNLDGIIRNYFF